MLAWEKYPCNKKLLKFSVKCFLNHIWIFIAKRIKVWTLNNWTLFQILVLFGKFKLFIPQCIKMGYFKFLFCIRVSLGFQLRSKKKMKWNPPNEMCHSVWNAFALPFLACNLISLPPNSFLSFFPHFWFLQKTYLHSCTHKAHIFRFY